MQREIDVTVSLTNLGGKGFAAYLEGSATEGKAEILCDMHATLWTATEEDINWKEIASESCVHELLHAFQELLGREFDEEEVEAAITAAREYKNGETSKI